MPRGRFITFEGGEGVGKSTQTHRLATRVRAAGFDVRLTREPGGTPRAEALREALLKGLAKDHGATAETLLFAAARIDHVDALIAPALAQGAWVVCDRFIDSTRAYQGALGQVDAALITALERVSIGAVRPDLTLVLDIPAEIGVARAAARRGSGVRDRFEAETLAYHRALRTAFLAIAAAEPERCVVIDARDDADAVEARIWAAVETRLGLAAAP